jgi:hypothetical protein
VTIALFEGALVQLGVGPASLPADDGEALDRDGFTILRNVFDAAQCIALRDMFERKYMSGEAWPFPRGRGARHSLLWQEEAVWRACLHPRILAAVHHILRRRFYLASVEGRDPAKGEGYQVLHRDWVAPQGPAPMVVALAFLDPFGPGNGATRLLPGTHLTGGGPDIFAAAGTDHPDQVVVQGDAGDVLVFDGYLAHAGTRNVSGAPRRNLQIGFLAIEEPGNQTTIRNAAAAPPDLRYMLGRDD